MIPLAIQARTQTNQVIEPIKTRTKYMKPTQREKVIGLGFISGLFLIGWELKWHQIFKPIRNGSNAKPKEMQIVVFTSLSYFRSLKTFILSVKLENIRTGTSLNIVVTQNSKT